MAHSAKHAMQYLRFDVAQSPEHAHDGERGGALVNCWMKDRTEEEAYRDAKAHIEKQGWMIVNLEIQYPMAPADPDDDAEGAEYVRQAEVDGEVFVFHSWPPEAYE